MGYEFFNVILQYNFIALYIFKAMRNINNFVILVNKVYWRLSESLLLS